ncbi:glycosyltransferase family 4 protein [Pelagibius litoralis]|uniref:Glycosyltransferase family 4 protein n=1 Tax=Pelagibius litoralis TaxID=374515 RepID=A0A967C227_9PROT|nr:glycosyltransferase [Pelagibius litoralis]NIA67643.1 glycosyltransferase family 4 protein [Pelagibius litoralis]
MKVLFATGHGYLPQRVGGSEASSHELILALREAGHDCSVLAQLQGNGWLAFRNRVLMKLLRCPLLSDRAPGYRVSRAWFPDRQVGRLLNANRPDLALVQAGEPLRMAKAFVDAGLPTMVYLRDVEFHELGGAPADLPSLGYLANSQFVAKRFQETFGITPSVIRPLFRAGRYTTARDPSQVTFVNPHPVKGVDLAFAIARLCPEIPFCFVEGWPMNREEQKALEASVAEHPNVRLQARTHDMREVYAATRCLLVPSQWEEAWGRVATEAHFSGIPVIGSNRGGLPEAVGPGGRVLPHDASPERWAATVREYWANDAVYEEGSVAASAYARRPEIDPQRQIEDLIAILSSFIGDDLPGAAGKTESPDDSVYPDAAAASGNRG